MKKLTDEDIAAIITAEERTALDYEGELAEKRAKLLNYYNCQPYGDEVEGQSQTVTSDVSDVIEWMLPSLIRIFTQGRLIARFDSDQQSYDQEAKDKTHLSNHVFMRENNGLLTLHNMFKDALLQYTGTVKVCWEEYKETTRKKYSGLSETELQRIQIMPNVEIDEAEYEDTEYGRVYDIEVVITESKGKVAYYNIPPEEFLISKEARDFVKPRFIGHRSPKRRSDLIEMGFDRKIVEELPAYEYFSQEQQKAARYHDYSDLSQVNTTTHHPNDEIYLGEYYAEIDVDGDGITETWKIFFAGDQVLEKEQVDEHPFAVCVPIPIPHRAIGSCPAEQVADIQFRKSVLVRQMLDNVYLSNYPRIMHSNKVDLDDLLTPRAAGTIEIDTDAADVAGHAQPLVIPNMIDGIMQAIQYTDTEREIRTGITRYSQGLDAEALNKTATGFKGIMDASQQRLDLIARIFAEGGVKRIFELTVKLLAEHQDTAMHVRILGEELEINPSEWGDNSKCRIDVGLGSGDRQEKIINLNNILAIQERYMGAGLELSDQTKLYNTLEKLIDEVGLKSAEEYFNNPEMPEQLLMAKLEKLFKENLMLKQMAQQNPLAEAELIKAQAKMAEVQGKETNAMRQFLLKYAQENQQFADEIRLEYAKLAQNGDQFAASMLKDLRLSGGQVEGEARP